MSRRVTTVGPEMNARFAMHVMLTAGVHHLPVVEGGRLVGILSDRDFLTWRDDVKLAEMPVGELMTRDPETAAPGDTIPDAASTMAALRIDCLPVLEDGRLLGILTTSDIVAERGRLLFKGGAGHVPSVASLMVEPICVLPGDSLVAAVSRMVRERIRHMIVADADRRVVGILSDRDLRLLLGDKQLKTMGEDVDGLEVRWAMTPSPHVIREDASIYELASYFIDERVGALPVVDEDRRLVGVVSYVDLLGYFIGRTKR